MQRVLYSKTKTADCRPPNVNTSKFVHDRHIGTHAAAAVQPSSRLRHELNSGNVPSAAIGPTSSGLLAMYDIIDSMVPGIYIYLHLGEARKPRHHIISTYTRYRKRKKEKPQLSIAAAAAVAGCGDLVSSKLIFGKIRVMLRCIHT